MKKVNLLFACVLATAALTGCGSVPDMFSGADRPNAAAPGPEDMRPRSRPGEDARTPPAEAKSAEEFDTTTAEERAAAAAVPEPAGEVALGRTVASLGDPARPGFWLETPLVDAPAKGRVEYPESGKSAQVDLIPIAGEATAGSRISLAAMRLIDAPLTELPTLLVFRN
ncbi:hypothetical protein PGB28_09530 [Primorskyibacter aestuariivivens]|uniref:hypothetical protein n=1 Tax=Primorskyibacter aestuariivivens TaxID=1888912 RepID=UPI0023018CD0|nr:hypothetical protein [Primorskyibacter aestuariivivens]MDA7428699.1 hypothetical protein [Primorskyibacter aestuariivivens]